MNTWTHFTVTVLFVSCLSTWDDLRIIELPLNLRILKLTMNTLPIRVVDSNQQWNNLHHSIMGNSRKLYREADTNTLLGFPFCPITGPRQLIGRSFSFIKTIVHDMWTPRISLNYIMVLVEVSYWKGKRAFQHQETDILRGFINCFILRIAN